MQDIAAAAERTAVDGGGFARLPAVQHPRVARRDPRRIRTLPRLPPPPPPLRCPPVSSLRRLLAALAALAGGR